MEKDSNINIMDRKFKEKFFSFHVILKFVKFLALIINRIYYLWLVYNRKYIVLYSSWGEYFYLQLKVPFCERNSFLFTEDIILHEGNIFCLKTAAKCVDSNILIGNDLIFQNDSFNARPVQINWNFV
jgi:hypothetical protein